MEAFLLAVLIGVPLAWHLAMTAYVAVDARRQGMDRRKWTIVALCVPFFGFFAYVFERDERTRDPESEPDFFTAGPFEIHESRADDAALFESGTDSSEDEGGAAREVRDASRDDGNE